MSVDFFEKKEHSFKYMFNHKKLFIVISLMVLIFTFPRIANATYAPVASISAMGMVDIFGQALSINDANEVLILGSLDRTAAAVHPLIWSEGMIQEITQLGSESDIVIMENASNAFNNLGEFTGYINHTETGTNQSFIYRKATGSLEYLGNSIEGIASSHIYGVAINENSQVMGYFLDSSGCYGVFLWENSSFKRLQHPEFGCFPTVTDISDSGIVIGYTYHAGESYGFAFDTTSQTLSKIQGTSLYPIRPKSINNTGTIVGTAGYGKAFQWQNGSLTILPTLGGDYSNAYSINDAGQIVGDSYLADNNESHAVLWENGVAVDLGLLVWESPETVSWGSISLSINSSGLIVGTNFSNDSSGQQNTPVLYDYVVTMEKKPKKIKKEKDVEETMSSTFLYKEKLQSSKF